eukprot:5429133-Amphidinium_carterae.2
MKDLIAPGSHVGGLRLLPLVCMHVLKSHKYKCRSVGWVRYGDTVWEMHGELVSCTTRPAVPMKGSKQSGARQLRKPCA